MIWNGQGLENGMSIVMVGNNSAGWTWTVTTPVTYTPFVLDFLVRFFKREPHIKDM